MGLRQRVIITTSGTYYWKPLIQPCLSPSNLLSVIMGLRQRVLITTSGCYAVYCFQYIIITSSIQPHFSKTYLSWTFKISTLYKQDCHIFTVINRTTNKLKLQNQIERITNLRNIKSLTTLDKTKYFLNLLGSSDKGHRRLG